MVVPVFPPTTPDDVLLGTLPFYHIYGAPLPARHAFLTFNF